MSRLLSRAFSLVLTCAVPQAGGSEILTLGFETIALERDFLVETSARGIHADPFDWTVRPSSNRRLAGIRTGGLAGGADPTEMLLRGFEIEVQLDSPDEVRFRYSQPSGKEGVIVAFGQLHVEDTLRTTGFNLSNTTRACLGRTCSQTGLLITTHQLSDSGSFELRIQIDPNADFRGQSIQALTVANSGTSDFYVDDISAVSVPEPSTRGILSVTILLAVTLSRRTHLCCAG